MAIIFTSFSFLMLGAVSLLFWQASIIGYPGHIYLKVLCSFLFVAAGIVCLIYLFSKEKENLQPIEKKLAILTMVGLSFGLLGDLFLDVANIKGNAFFLLGLGCFVLTHIFYLVLLFSGYRLSFWDLIVFVLLFGGGILIGKFVLQLQLGGMTVPCILYAAVISAMLTRALSFLWAGSSSLPGAYSWVFLAGALLFFISDAILVVMMFGGQSAPWMEKVNAYTYFYGQLLVAFTPALLTLSKMTPVQ